MTLQLAQTRGAQTPAPCTDANARRRLKTQLIQIASVAVLATSVTGCGLSLDLNGDGSDPSPDGTYTSDECKSDATPVSHPNEGTWQAVLLNDVMPGADDYNCANGDPYKFFVQFNTGATDLTVSLEPGGACWDYETCNYEAGWLNPVRLHGVPDNLMTNLQADPDPTKERPRPWAAMYPHFGRIDNGVATNKYNHVFFPYCTGDAFTGDVINTYTDGTNSFTVEHRGRRNLEAASTWLATTFPAGYTGQLLVVGSSAGAIGAATSYPLIRDTIAPKCGAMVNDSGPIFPPKGRYDGDLYGPYTPTAQQGLLDRVSVSWDLEGAGGVVEKLDQRFGNRPYRLVRDHFGHINRGLSRTYPNDRFLFTTFKQDMNFSLFSFVGSGVIPPGDDIADEVGAMWRAEVEDFRRWIDTDRVGNWGYYLPNYRPDNCSHMVATAPMTLMHDRVTGGYARQGIAGHANGYFRTEIGDTDLGDAIRTLLDPQAGIPKLQASDDDPTLSFSHPDSTVVPSDRWYNLDSGELYDTDQAKRDHVAQQKVGCVNTNGYPQSN